jgi:hypothetical protein
MYCTGNLHLFSMKSTFLLLFVICYLACLKATAQNVKLYGYVQKVTPGISATVELDENGNRVKRSGASMENYFMYLAGPANSRVYLVEGWIKGERVGLKGTTVKTPVQITASSETGKVVEVVPKSTAMVWQLTGTTAPAGKTFEKAKRLAQTNEMVVVYRLNGQFRYATLKNLTPLETAHLQ